MEDQVVQDALGGLPLDRRDRLGELLRLELADRHAAAPGARGAAASGARSFSSTSTISSSLRPTTREQPSPCIVTPNRRCANFSVTLRSEITMNWARSALRRRSR